ncbi:MAG TPA: hypothetical protein VFP27_19180, partial [Mycobacterium sp.]|nr:hypothetical protein [Mycobacterium sp.]
SLVRALNDGRWIVRSPEPTLLRGLRYKQPVSVFQYTEIPFWWADGRTRLRQGGAPRDVEGTYNVAGLIQFMAWHLGVAERLVAIEFSPFITVQGPAPPWSVFTVLPEGSADVTRRVLHVHTTLQRDLAGFLHVVRYADLNEALTYQTHVVALRDIAAALLALEATPAPVEDRWETFLRIGFTELFVQRWGQAILFGHRAPVPDDHRLNRGLDDPGGVFQPLQQPLRWFEQRFGRQAALALWRGPDRFFRLRDELHRWLLWAFHRHPDPEVQAHAVELFDLVRFGPMGNQGWGELESNAVPLFFRGLWEDLDRGKHGLRFWREVLSNPGRLDGG